MIQKFMPKITKKIHSTKRKRAESTIFLAISPKLITKQAESTIFLAIPPVLWFYIKPISHYANGTKKEALMK